jgi:hypothetical protein
MGKLASLRKHGSVRSIRGTVKPPTTEGWGSGGFIVLKPVILEPHKSYSIIAEIDRNRSNTSWKISV